MMRKQLFEFDCPYPAVSRTNWFCSICWRTAWCVGGRVAVYDVIIKRREIFYRYERQTRHGAWYTGCVFHYYGVIFELEALKMQYVVYISLLSMPVQTDWKTDIYKRIDHRSNSDLRNQHATTQDKRSVEIFLASAADQTAMYVIDRAVVVVVVEWKQVYLFCVLYIAFYMRYLWINRSRHALIWWTYFTTYVWNNI